MKFCLLDIIWKLHPRNYNIKEPKQDLNNDTSVDVAALNGVLSLGEVRQTVSNCLERINLPQELAP